MLHVQLSSLEDIHDRHVYAIELHLSNVPRKVLD